MKYTIAATTALLLSAGIAGAEGAASTTPNTLTTTVASKSFDGSHPLIPKGYRLAWTDDRLNPYRGVGTPRGEAAMRLIWTDDVPRRLVAQ